MRWGSFYSCDDSVGFVVNKTTANSTNQSVSTLNANLKTANGSYERTLNQTNHYSQTASTNEGVKTSVSDCTTTGGATGN
jgi:hypothetical protein